MLDNEQLKNVLLKKELTDEEMLMVIQRYIYDKKNIKVNIKRPNTVFRLQLMNNAYNSAVSYFVNDVFNGNLLNNDS